MALGAEPEADCERERRDARDLVVHLVIADAEGKREPVGVRAALRGKAEVLDPKAERREEIEAHEDEKPVAEWRPEYGPGREGSGPGGRDAPAVTRVSLARAVEAVGDRHELVERVEEPRAHEEALAERTPVGVAGAARRDAGPGYQVQSRRARGRCQARPARAAQRADGDARARQSAFARTEREGVAKGRHVGSPLGQHARDGELLELGEHEHYRRD